MDSMFSCYCLLSIKVIWLYYLVFVNPYKVMSGYLYFPNNVKDIKDHNDNLQNLFPINSNSFQRNVNLWLPLIFYSNVMVVFEKIFISDQIAENRSVVRD